MSVYVDTLFYTSPSRRWKYELASHMIADTPEELEQMARKLGLKRSWKHGDHYDLTPNKQLAAINAGAILLDRKTFIKKRHESIRDVRR